MLPDRVSYPGPLTYESGALPIALRGPTDHDSLIWLARFEYIEGQLARWNEELSQYNFRILHFKDAKHINADVWQAKCTIIW